MQYTSVLAALASIYSKRNTDYLSISFNSIFYIEYIYINDYVSEIPECNIRSESSGIFAILKKALLHFYRAAWNADAV